MFNIIYSGTPCQDNSDANSNGKGLRGDHSQLWYEMLRLIQQYQPRFILWENVEGCRHPKPGQHISPLGEVLWSLKQSGYNAEWQTISAAAIGAPHRRNRIFLIAYPTGLFRQAPPWSDQIGSEIAAARMANPWLGTQPPICGIPHGLPNRMDRLSALGNAVVPAVAAVAFKRILYLNSL